MTRSDLDSVFPPFDRRFLDSDRRFTVIGEGALGGKAKGLAFVMRLLAERFPADRFPRVDIDIPTLTVLTTDAFEGFISHNDLEELALSGAPDERIAHAFLKAEMPPLIVGDLRALVADLHTPLAVRSSSLLEDALNHPFAGTYETKMIPNNQADVDSRFARLIEAIKFVWASTFFRDAKSYMRAIGRSSRDERMAVIIQEVIGRRYDDRFYPTISGVVRTFNYYAASPLKPEDGVVNLALGLGKTIVDGEVSWTYAPSRPRHASFGSARDMLKNTQTRFWAVNMGPSPAHDPVAEAEYLVQASLAEAEQDGSLKYIASTYDAAGDRLTIGTGTDGARVLTFAPTLDLQDVPLNAIVRELATCCREAFGTDVEIEFAMSLDPREGLPARFGFLQVRPMLVAEDQVDVSESDLTDPRALLATETVLGNGALDTLCDVIYVRPEAFEARHTRRIAEQIERLNHDLHEAGRPYVLIGFGRWGSRDPWLGIPVPWPAISGARVIVEATLPEMHVDPSQGSHFFHNMTSFRVHYLTVSHTGSYAIRWDWLDAMPAVAETELVRHVRTARPLVVRVDGRSRRGVVLMS